MNNNNVSSFEIDIKQIGKAIWRKLWLVALGSIVCAVLALVYTIYMITPLYKSSAMFYVNNGKLSVGNVSVGLSSSDIAASKSLVDTYIVILKSRACLADVMDYAELDYSYAQLKGMISANAVSSTEVFEVVVTNPDAKEAEKIANAIAYILPKRISDIVEGTTAKIVDYAVVAASPSSPSRSTNTMLGFIVGFLLTVAGVVLREFFDTTIRTEEDVTQNCKYPILATVPEMTASFKGGYYYYAHGDKKEKHKRTYSSNGAVEATPLFGADISFAAAETFKLIRTKLQFSFTDGKKSHVIGISSAFAGEGKSVTAINLAYALAQLEKRVLLIDCDMRRPSLAMKLNIRKNPGLSNFLTGNAEMEDLIQQSDKDSKINPFNVITAGRVPPNPIELLSSAKMEEAIETLGEQYDYIILDLPPVGEVSDAMATVKFLDGLLFVVCQNYCSRSAFVSAINQFEFVGARILGVVLNRVNDNSHGYGLNYYRKNRKRSYDYGYGYGYGASHRHSKDDENKEK